MMNIGVIIIMPSEELTKSNEELPKWKQNKKAYNKTYNAEWKKNNTEQLNLEIPKGKKDELKALAERENTTVKGLFSQALQEKYGINLERKKD